jgi:uncharacterized membrane protein YhaH (DUF805 family)
VVDVTARSEPWWQVLVYALVSGVAAFVTGLLLHKSSSDALIFAGVFGGVGLLVRGCAVYLGRRRRAADKPEILPPYGPPPVG